MPFPPSFIFRQRTDLLRKYLLAAAASAAIASPAAAQDGGGYVGIEGGLLFPKDMDTNLGATFTQTGQTPAAGTQAAAFGFGVVGALPASLLTAPAAIGGGLDFELDRGLDGDVIAGYDFGFFRLEGELGYKRTKIDTEGDEAFFTALETGLTPTGTTGTAFDLDEEDFDLSDRVSVLSLMGNALADFGDDNIGFYAGAGFGRARVKLLGERDSSWAMQLIAGVRTAISPNIDLGLKYRYFRTRKLDFNPGDASFASSRTIALRNVDDPATPLIREGANETNVTFTRTALVSGEFQDRFSSHSLLASLIFNFGAPAEATYVAPVAAPPPPPPVAPATQTCPDGSLILATDICPAPPPPPPPPPPGPERG